VRVVRTSLNGPSFDKMTSGAFLASSINSGLEGITAHRLKKAILNMPGLV
jgi:hypothetical protein